MASADSTEEKSAETATPADEFAREWIVERLTGTTKTGKQVWTPAADFKKQGKLVPVTCEKALHVVEFRQKITGLDSAKYIYRIRNIRTDAVLMGAVL